MKLLKVYAVSMLCVLFSLVQAQDERYKYAQNISFAELLKRINESPSDSVRISDLNIIADPATDQRFITDVRGTENWDSLSATMPEIVIDKAVFLHNVHFGQMTVLPKIRFKGMLHMEDVSVYGDLYFRACTFEQISYGHIMESYYFGYDRCTFERGLAWEKMNAVQAFMTNCQVNEDFSFYNVADELILAIYNTRFKVGTGSFFTKNSGKLLIRGCRFDSLDAASKIYFGSNTILASLDLIRDTFNLDFSMASLSVKEMLRFSHCTFNARLNMLGANLPEVNTSIPWNQISNHRLAIKVAQDTFFTAKAPYQKRFEDAYLNLLKNYSQLLRTYKYNGDTDSYNACYIEMKDMVTRKAAFTFKEQPTTTNFFVLYLNRFLKMFCDYGTSPVKALIISGKLILLFALLYFFFPSEGTAVFKPLGWRLWRKADRKAWYTEFQKHANWPTVKRLSMQLLNATALSMNAFVTLGYGDMPARGVSRYLAVFEGLMGWFLLSIFSASLISQMLQ